MKLNSISGVSYQVADVEASTKFYESLGMRVGKHDDKRATVYVNWFSVDLIAEDTAKNSSKGTGHCMRIKVDAIDECYQDLIAEGMQPETEPTLQASGNSEFTLSDPDGYQLVFFEKK